MARIFAFLFLTLAMNTVMLGPVAAQTSAPPNESIRSTISSQMDAFQAEDFERAFSYAAPNIKGMFGTAERFGTMVRNGYPMVWQNTDIRYLELREISGNLWQMVQVEDLNGAFHYLDYMMVKTNAGWQIAAVQYLPDPGVGA